MSQWKVSYYFRRTPLTQLATLPKKKSKKTEEELYRERLQICGVFLNQVMNCPEFGYSVDLVKFLSENDDKFKTYSEARKN